VSAPAPALPLVPSEEVSLLRESVYGIASKYGHAYAMDRADAGEPPTELWDALAERGFLGVNLPEEYGGGGLGLSALVPVGEELARAGCPLLMIVVSPAIAGSILDRHGTEEQKEVWLRGIAAGRVKVAFAITEPDAGSNSHRISTVARRVDGGFVLRGSKTFISGVEDADAILVVAKSGAHEDALRGGLSLLLVDADSPGLERQEIRTAVRAPEKQWLLYFDDVEVGRDRLVGGEGEGLKLAFDGLNPERIMGAAIGTGIARLALERATDYARERSVWGAPIGTHQGVSHPLAEAKIELELARLATERAAALYDARAPAAAEASNIAKYAAAEASIRCVDQAIQTHGGNGLSVEYGLTDLYWVVRVLRTAPVSREMILNFVAEHSLGLPKSY
jgi:alkylation response protein AidB-like acyl-CoA dehydrogenase